MKSIKWGLAFAVFLAMSLLGAGTVLGVEFSDAANSPYLTGIELLQERGVVNGYPDGTYRPATTMNRAEMLKIVAEATVDDADFVAFENDDCFEDVSASTWYTKYVCYGRENGWVVGYENGTLFRPEQKVTFVEALKMTFMAFDIEFTEQTTPWYKNLVEVAATDNYIPHLVTAFDENFSREKMADLVARILSDADGNLDEYLGDRNELVVNYETILETSKNTNSTNFFKEVPYDWSKGMPNKTLKSVKSIKKYNEEAGTEISILNVFDNGELIYEGTHETNSVSTAKLNNNNEVAVFFQKLAYENCNCYTNNFGVLNLTTKTFKMREDENEDLDPHRLHFNDQGHYIIYKGNSAIFNNGEDIILPEEFEPFFLMNNDLMIGFFSDEGSETTGIRKISLWKDGNLTHLDSPLSPAVIASVNDNEEMTISKETEPGNGIYNTYLWQNGVLKDIGINGLGYLNNQIQIIGSAHLNGDQVNFFIFLWEDGRILDLSRFMNEDMIKNIAGATPFHNEELILLSYTGDLPKIVKLPSNYKDYLLPLDEFFANEKPRMFKPIMSM